MSKEGALIKNAVKLIELLQTNKLAKEKLTSHQRKVIVKYIMEEQSTWSNAEIAELIGCTDVNVGLIKRGLLRNSTWEIDALDVKVIAASRKKHFEEYRRRALAKGDIRLAWDMEGDFIEEMQSLGFVYEAPKKVGFFVDRDFERKMKEFFDEHGVPTVDEFIAQLEQVGGDGRKRIPLLVAGSQQGNPEGSDREPSREGPA